MEKKIQFFKECPVCGKELGGQEDKCPYCGFEGLDTVFLSREDYVNWQETILNPYKEMIKPLRIFAGHPGVLILMFNGDLYGYGNNDTGAFGEENYGILLTKPQLIAENVKSAALGYNFSIYLTKEGKVELLGKRRNVPSRVRSPEILDAVNVPFRERFQGIPDADEVYASGSNDIFWVKYKNGKLGVWGTNTDGQIAEVTKLPLGEYDIREGWKRLLGRLDRWCGNLIGAFRYFRFWIAPAMEKIEEVFQETEELRMYVEKYSAANIVLDLKKEKDMGEKRETIERETRQTLDCATYTTDVLYKIYMYYQNNYLYHPTAVQEDVYYEPELVKSGSGLINCDELDRWGWLYGVKIEYFRYYFSAYIARLSEDGRLDVVQYDQKGSVYATYEEVMDVSASASYAYILTKDRILYRLPLEDFINAKKLSEAEVIEY